jgi:hypothetical protein
MIRAARPEEIALLPQIENAADQRYTLGVSWNAPFYERCGFASVPRKDWPRAFRLQFMIENHPPWRRTIMQRRV